MAKQNGIVLYQGPSMIDGAPIVVIATGLASGSNNAKTGSMVQTWILRQDISPLDAIASGDDASICGDCAHRGDATRKRSCYVNVFQAPMSVWKSWRRGIYPYAGERVQRWLMRGRKVRLGSYGDPAAVPYGVWHNVCAEALAHTGYTHQWSRCDQRLARLCMASVDNPPEHVRAKAKGWRTFRTRLGTEELATREIACPASAERGHVTNCDACVACGGNGAKARVDIAIIAHGAAHLVARYREMREAV